MLISFHYRDAVCLPMDPTAFLESEQYICLIRSQLLARTHLAYDAAYQ